MLFVDKLGIDSERKYTDEGFLQVPAVISRIGVQVYTAGEMGLTDRDPKDSINVFRPPEEVFKQESMDSFANKPITNNHPPELVTSDNAKLYSVGMSGATISKEDGFVKTVLHVLDKTAIADIESGKVELSNGYLSDIDWTSGISLDGASYDAIQRNIRGNHIAIVERGRAGSDCRVADNSPTTGDGTIMAKITIDGVDFEVTDQAAQAVQKLQSKLSDAENESQKKDEEMKAAEAKKKEDEEAEKKKETSDSNTIDALVAERTELIDNAKKVKSDLNYLNKSNADIRNQVVADNFPDIDMSEVSEDYVRARFDTLVETAISNTQHTLDSAFQDQAKGGGIKDNRSISQIARDKMMEDSRNAWKKDDK